jgi:hypothetical protein
MINPVDLLFLHGRKRDARRAARRFSLFDLSDYAKRYKIETSTRFQVAAYLLGLIPWRELETDLLKCRTIRIPLA